MKSWRKRTVAGCALMGSIILIVAIYLFFVRITFLTRASSFDAPVVAVTHEYVPKGRGSALAYVPTVEVRDSQGRLLQLKVDTSSEAPVFALGQRLRVICNPDRGCIENTFVASWGDGLIDLAISLVLFAPLLYYKVVPQKADPTTRPLNFTPDA